MRELLKNFRNGVEPITDSDLDAILQHYHVLVAALAHHGDLYRIVWVDASKEYDHAKGMYFTRNNKHWKQ